MAVYYNNVTTNKQANKHKHTCTHEFTSKYKQYTQIIYAV